MRLRRDFNRTGRLGVLACLLSAVQACSANDVNGTGASGGGNDGASAAGGGGSSSVSGGGVSGGGTGVAEGESGRSGASASGASGAPAGGNEAGGAGSSDGASFTQRVLVDDLASPWEIVWGPDGWLWVTEREGKRVVRISPTDGALQVALELDEVSATGSQDGLLGMALHPQLTAGTNEDFVYVAYSYEGTSGRRFKLRRYTFDAASGTLAAPLDVLAELPASTDHNGGRLRIGPDGKLYYTVGDQGANQFERKCEANHAQELPSAADVSSGDYSSYRGKILRMNLDGSIPDDNPELSGARSHIFSFGHRNPQGIAFDSNGVLHSSEQGPKSDDELNRIDAGKNYGWPHVAGFQDDKSYVYGNWSAAPDCEQLAFSDYTLPASVPQQKESEWAMPGFAPPLLTFYTVESGFDFEDPKCGGNANVCWPTIAPSSLEFYSAAPQALRGWPDSWLVPSLKRGTVYRVAANDAGEPQVTELFKTTNRYRDVAVNPDGRTFYVITDRQGSTGSVDGGATSELENRGSVLEFTAD